MAYDKKKSAIGADFMTITDTKADKLKTAVYAKPAPAADAETAPAKAAEDPAALASVNVRVPVETRDALQLMAGEECLPMAVYMRQLLAAVADPATAAPELSKKLIQIDRDRPRNTTVLKQQINKKESGPMVGIGVRVPQGTVAALQEAAEFRKLTLSLYLRYILVSLTAE